MKKTVVFIWMLAYIALTTGISVNLHYCMDRLDSTKLFASAKKVCSKCGMSTAKKHGCCRDEVQVIKVDDDQRTPVTTTFDFALADQALPVYSTDLFLSPQQTLAAHETALPPPLPDTVDACILNCVYRI